MIIDEQNNIKLHSLELKSYFNSIPILKMAILQIDFFC